MTPTSIVILAFSMSADAFAAALARGASLRPTVGGAFRGGLVFGAIESATPLLGWAIGLASRAYVAAVDHWIAFALLVLVGGKMVVDGAGRIRTGEQEAERPAGSGLSGLVLTAIATSVDAAAVGVTLALVDADIVIVALAIGATTFFLATTGLLVGRVAGRRFGPGVEMAGGLGLIAIGARILVDHIG